MRDGPERRSLSAEQGAKPCQTLDRSLIWTALGLVPTLPGRRGRLKGTHERPYEMRLVAAPPRCTTLGDD
jgi:hypothetical protein